ncbi:MAG: nuclear transport factor 2 family protein [Candidatus Kariarchaeaceae archaeon]|jgi:hypothetical protein
MEKSEEIRNLVLKLYTAMGSGDHAFFQNAISKKDGVLAIGTDPKEWWDGYNTITRVFKAQLDEMKGFKITGDPQAYRQGSTGWFADQASVKFPDGSDFSMRLTGVVNQETDAWKIVQWHVSLGVANEEVLGKELPTE